MDPQNPASFNHRTETLSTGRTYHFVDQLPDDYDSKRTPTLLCVHGFPDLWFGWRYQIGPWVRKGCRVVVPDMLGYGDTDKPSEASEYSTKKLCADLASLLDILSIRQAVVIGHDWGAYAAGRFALWYPKRLLALIIMSVPYMPPSRVYLPVEEVVKLAPNLGYQADFAKQATTADIEANLERFLSVTFRQPPSKENYLRQGTLKKVLVMTGEGPSVLNDNELKYYYSELKKGMTGPLNYYKTAKYRYDEERGLPANLPPNLPVLFLWGTLDGTSTPFLIDKSRKFINRLQDVALEGRGHWILTEAKDEVAEKVITWLHGLTSRPNHSGKL